jgi:hypothetical protein
VDLLYYTTIVGFRQGALLTESISGWGYPLVASSPFLYYNVHDFRLHFNKYI